MKPKEIKVMMQMDDTIVLSIYNGRKRISKKVVRLGKVMRCTPSAYGQKIYYETELNSYEA